MVRARHLPGVFAHVLSWPITFEHWATRVSGKERQPKSLAAPGTRREGCKLKSVWHIRACPVMGGGVGELLSVESRAAHSVEHICCAGQVRAPCW